MLINNNKWLGFSQERWSAKRFLTITRQCVYFCPQSVLRDAWLQCTQSAISVVPGIEMFRPELNAKECSFYKNLQKNIVFIKKVKRYRF